MDERVVRRVVVGLAFLGFVSLGLPDVVLGVAWPSIRGEFARPVSGVGVLLAGGTAGYLVSSFLGGTIVRRVGVGRLLVGSCGLVVVGLLGTAVMPWWWGMVGCAAVSGLGAGAIDGGINTYAASRFSARVVNWLHASWGVGATAGPLVMTAVIVSGLGWRVGYGVLAGVMVLLTVLFAMTVKWWEAGGVGGAGHHDEAHGASLWEAARRPMVWVQVGLFFLYTGTEATAGALLFTLLTEGRGEAVGVAGTVVGVYWGMLTVGRVVFGQLSASVSREAVLRIGASLAPVAAGLVWWGPGRWVTFAGVALLGFAFAPVYPTMVSLTPGRVGKRFAAQAMGFQVAAGTLGIAVWPGVVGGMTKGWGLEVVGAYLVVATLFLLVLQEGVMRAGRRGRGEIEPQITPINTD